MNTRTGDPQAQVMRVDGLPGLGLRLAEQGWRMAVRLDTGWYEVEFADVERGMVHVHFTDPDQGGVWFPEKHSTVWVRWGLGDGQEWVDATEVKPGDVVHNAGEVSWRVREVGTRPGRGPAEGTTWVVLTGDDDEGYFQKFYGGEQVYHAATDEPVAVSWPRQTT